MFRTDCIYSYYNDIFFQARHLYEQDMLIVEVDVLVQQFDSRLQQLQRERIRVQVTCRLQNIFIL